MKPLTAVHGNVDDPGVKRWRGMRSEDFARLVVLAAVIGPQPVGVAGIIRQI
jgi:hypothetical protein